AVDAVWHLIGFGGVFTSGRNNKLSHILGPSLRLASGGEQALFGIGSRPITKPSKESLAPAALFNPIEGNGLVLEPPCTNERKGLIQKWVNGPQEERAIAGREA